MIAARFPSLHAPSYSGGPRAGQDERNRDGGTGRLHPHRRRQCTVLFAYLLFNRGIEIGAGPAGQSMHLMPLFGSVLAVVCLGENFRLYHAVGIALICAGILLASWRAVQPAAATAAHKA